MIVENCVLDVLNKYERPLLIGPFPPPLGGVSVHIQRLLTLSKNAQVFDTSVGGGLKFIKLFLTLFLRQHKIVHVHVLTIKILVIVLFARFFKPMKLMLTDHNSRLFEKKSNFEIYVLEFLLGKSDYLVVVGPHIKENYLTRKIKGAETALVCNSFLPPPQNDEESILRTYPKSYFEFVKRHSPLVSTNAYQLIIKDEVDLYGIDMSIELLKKLKDDYPNIGLIVFLADDCANSTYLNILKSRIFEYDLIEDVIFITGQKELWPTYKTSNLMVRPTSTDGFGVSIAEAIHLGCPALASDVCERAEGTVLFSNRNMNDFFNKAKLILDKAS